MPSLSPPSKPAQKGVCYHTHHHLTSSLDDADDARFILKDATQGKVVKTTIYMYFNSIS